MAWIPRERLEEMYTAEKEETQRLLVEIGIWKGKAELLEAQGERSRGSRLRSASHYSGATSKRSRLEGPSQPRIGEGREEGSGEGGGEA